MRQHCFPQSQHCCWIFRATVWIHSLMWRWGIWSIYTYMDNYKSLRFQGSIKHWRAEKRVRMFIIILLLLWLASGHLRLLCDGVCLDAALMGSERYLCTLEKTQKTNLDPISTCMDFFPDRSRCSVVCLPLRAQPSQRISEWLALTRALTESAEWYSHR